jgi:hypothetical protein
MALALAAPAQARPQAVIAFLPPGPGEKHPLLEELAARGMAIGMTSPLVGGFEPAQVALDMTQGTRIPTRLYAGRIPPLRVRGDHLSGWAAVVRRADKAPGDLKPGLLASAIEAAGGRVGYSAPGRGFSPAPVVASNRAGGLTDLQKGDTLGVFQLAPGGAGLRQLDLLLAARRRDDLVYVVRAPYGTKLRLLPSGIAGPGCRGQLRSATTRRTGLIAATDVAPTVLRAVGIAVPGDMQGLPIETRGRADPRGLERMAGRLAVVTGRRGVVLEWLVGTLVLLLAGLMLTREPQALRVAARTALLAALWVPGLALLTAALRPDRLVEAAVIGIGAVILGALTDRLVRWPAAPALPAAVVFAAHAIDLARGSPWIGASITGPNPAGGARFFGIGNELEVILSCSVLVGAGAALAWRGQSRRAPLAFGAVAVVAALIMGAGRLGADVGAVITLGAGGAAAVIASLETPPSRRTIALGIAAPVLAIGVLVLLDLATGGGAHLTRSVVHGHGSGGLGDVVRRRFDGSLSNLHAPVQVLLFALALVAVVWLAARRRVILKRVPRPFAAGLTGAWFAVVVGALANDSGPLILEIGAIFLLLVSAYASGRPESVATPLS